MDFRYYFGSCSRFGITCTDLQLLPIFMIGFNDDLILNSAAIQWRGKLSFYGSTGLCFPIHLDDPYSVGWQYTSFVIVGMNTIWYKRSLFSNRF